MMCMIITRAAPVLVYIGVRPMLAFCAGIRFGMFTGLHATVFISLIKTSTGLIIYFILEHDI